MKTLEQQFAKDSADHGWRDRNAARLAYAMGALAAMEMALEQSVQKPQGERVIGLYDALVDVGRQTAVMIRQTEFPR